jgi:hypothetical protein
VLCSQEPLEEGVCLFQIIWPFLPQQGLPLACCRKWKKGIDSQLTGWSLQEAPGCVLYLVTRISP